MKGYFAYFAVPTNTYLLSAFRYHTSKIWYRGLRRRSQRHRGRAVLWTAYRRHVTKHFCTHRQDKLKRGTVGYVWRGP
jgi:hypothetical protein